MGAYYEAAITAVKTVPYGIFDNTDTPQVRLQKVKQAFGVSVVDGKNVISDEDTPVKEPLLSKLSVDQKLRLADLLDTVVAGTQLVP